MNEASCNTGVQTPLAHERRGPRVLIDWLSGTLPVHRPDCAIDLIPGTEPWTPIGRGAYGYRQALQRNGVKVLFDGRADMGVLVDLSGSACRELETVEGFSWTTFMSACVARGFRPSRVDVAFDDLNGRLSMDVIRRHRDLGHLTCRARYIDSLVRQSARTGGRESETIYFGSRASDTKIRIYEKLAEPKTCKFVRVEFEARRGAARAVFRRIADGSPAAAVSLLAGQLMFRDPGGHHDKSRWPVSSWWSEFLNHAKREPLGVAPRHVHAERRDDWLRRQVSPSLARHVGDHGGDLSALHRLHDYGCLRLGGQRCRADARTAEW